MLRAEFRYPGALVVLVLVAYALTTYGGIRSPDSEVVFRTCESLASDGSWAIEPLEPLPGFGVAPGRGGRFYSVFGPLESLVCAPIYWLGAATGVAPQSVPPSRYVDDGLRLMLDRQWSGSGPHRIRFVASFLNVILGAVNVLLFYLLIRALRSPPVVATILGLIFAFATLHWSYSGTFFSEILALTLVLSSLLILVRRDASVGEPAASGQARQMISAGVFLGFSAAAHLSAVLFAPFFWLYAVVGPESGSVRRAGWWRGLQFAVGGAVPLVFLGLYNLYRFGSLFETGRGVIPDAVSKFGYGTWVAPLSGLQGLLVSPGKGLLFFCPIVLLGLVAAPALLRRHRVLFLVLVSTLVFRLVVVASRSDWHGGFGPGPRYLLLIIPLLLVPLAAWYSESPTGLRLFVLVTSGVLSAVQQFYFVLGEVFYFYHSIWTFAEQNNRPDLLDNVYFEWGFSPLLFLLQGTRSPWTLRFVELSNLALMVGFSILAGLAALAMYRLARADESKGTH